MNNRRGVVLPIVAALLFLILMSVFLMADFGSQTRAVIARLQTGSSISFIAQSALLEARRSLDTQLNKGQDQWPSQWSNLLNSSTTPSISLPEIDVPLSKSLANEQKAKCQNVQVKCLHLQVENNRGQGLLSFIAIAEGKTAAGKTLTISCEQRVLLRTIKNPNTGVSRIILAREAASFKESD